MNNDKLCDNQYPKVGIESWAWARGFQIYCKTNSFLHGISSINLAN